jgi:hypothetical protein
MDPDVGSRSRWLVLPGARVEVGAPALPVENDDDLDGALRGRDRVRHHRRELRGLALLDEQDALAEL